MVPPGPASVVAKFEWSRVAVASAPATAVARTSELVPLRIELWMSIDAESPGLSASTSAPALSGPVATAVMPRRVAVPPPRSSTAPAPAVAELLMQNESLIDDPSPSLQAERPDVTTFTRLACEVDPARSRAADPPVCSIAMSQIAVPSPRRTAVDALETITAFGAFGEIRAIEPSRVRSGTTRVVSPTNVAPAGV